MSEHGIFFSAGGLQIQGLLDERPGERGVVVTHPHPLYGGDMHNNVVEAVCEAYRQKGYTTLRFNFRGVGESAGGFDDGVGEEEDVAAALAYLAGKGKKGVDLAGYSFGAWVIARGLPRFDLASRVIMVSPPLDFLDFSTLREDARVRLVVSGSRDEFGRPDRVKEAVAGWNRGARLKIIEGADHFYWDRTPELMAVIKEFLDEGEGAFATGG